MPNVASGLATAEQPEFHILGPPTVRVPSIDSRRIPGVQREIMPQARTRLQVGGS